jgi:D-alanyl-D-alanine carboxypeptidase
MRTRDVVRADVVANKAAAMAVGDPYSELKPIALDEAKLDAYAGVYGNRQERHAHFPP